MLCDCHLQKDFSDETLKVYKSRNILVKLFSGDKDHLRNRRLGLQSDKAAQEKTFYSSRCTEGSWEQPETFDEIMTFLKSEE